MPDYPYTTVVGKVEPFFAKVREVGVPTKVTTQWLQVVGFKSTNDRSLIPVIRFIDFIDTSGNPTSRWKNYRGGKHKQVIAEAIKFGYSALFDIYPDAWNRSTEDIEHVVSTTSSAGKQAVQKTVSTFQTLCKLADFSSLFSEDQQSSEINSNGFGNSVSNNDVIQANTQAATRNSLVPSVHIDIQVHISPESTPEQIDKIFESMAKHLYKSEQ